MNKLEPDQIADIAARVIAAERMNFGSTSTRDERNKNWARIAGIIHHGHPQYNLTADPRWHIKDAGGGRPQSDDVLAFKDTRMIIDFIGSAGADGFTVRAGHWEGPIGPEQNIYAPPVPDGGGGVVAPPTPPPSEVWTAAHQATWDALKAKGLTTPLIVAQQLNHRFPGQVWGQKRAGVGRGISDNTIAMRMADGRLYGVKISPFVHLWGLLEPAQVMEGHGAGAVNHLGDAPPPPPPPPAEPPTEAPVKLPPMDDRFDAIDRGIAALALATAAIGRDVAQQRADLLEAVREQSYQFAFDNAPWPLKGARGVIGPIEKKKE